MKSKTPESPKVESLMDELDLPRYAAVGLLEYLWHNTASHAPRGNIGKYGNRAIARRLDWRGDPDKLIAALIATGWVDEDPEHRLVVHDWPEHCEDAVDMKLARAGDTYAVGLWPRMNRLKADERDRCKKRIQEKLSDEQSRRAHSVHTMQAKDGQAASHINSGTYEEGESVLTPCTHREHYPPLPSPTLPPHSPSLDQGRDRNRESLKANTESLEHAQGAQYPQEPEESGERDTLERCVVVGSSSDSGSPSAGNPPQGVTDEAESLSRSKAFARWQALVVSQKMIGRADGANHPAGSPQHAADLTSMARLFDRVWPEGIESADESLIQRYETLKRLTEGAGGKRVPMAYLTSQVKKEIAELAAIGQDHHEATGAA